MRGTILSMLDSSRTNFLSIYWICGSNTLCSASSARQQEIFAGTNFRELAFDRENRENFCLAKISRYMVDQLSTCLVSLVTSPRAPPGEKRHKRVGSGDETSVYLP